ncbi:MAG: hypothetical protein IT492_12790 [Gammaproteobacteria bacterium]|nr:hypothetical protein [Gammaproteobacteria bacterium]
MTTMIKLLVVAWLALAASASVTAAEAQAAQQPAEVKFSEAETRMWMTDQLRNVTKPINLRYDFHKTGSLEPDFNFDDKVELKVEKINADGSKDGTVQFFTGEHNFPAPPMESVTVNPVLGHYLYGDVMQMNRLTDPNGEARERWRYFQRRIKFSLSEDATVKPVSFEFNGRTWKGYEISFVPYAKDPKRNLFEKFADKRYSVTVSDELPGYLYRIETIIPDAKPEQPPLIREVLQLSAAKPAS